MCSVQCGLSWRQEATRNAKSEKGVRTLGKRKQKEDNSCCHNLDPNLVFEKLKFSLTRLNVLLLDFTEYYFNSYLEILLNMHRRSSFQTLENCLLWHSSSWHIYATECTETRCPSFCIHLNGIVLEMLVGKGRVDEKLIRSWMLMKLTCKSDADILGLVLFRDNRVCQVGRAGVGGALLRCWERAKTLWRRWLISDTIYFLPCRLHGQRA